MAPLSNAERQKRYRENLKARAAGLDLAARTREAIMAAAQLVWDMAQDGNDMLPDVFASMSVWLEDLRTPKPRKSGTSPVIELRVTFEAFLHDATDEQRAVLQLALDLLDAVELR